MRLVRRGLIAVVALVIGGCGTDLLPAEVVMPAGSRVWIITVENASNAPVELAVAEDRMPMGELVGNAQPSSVAPGRTQEVVFSVPPGGGWAIFVNPTDERGPLIIASDVPPGITGRLPVQISVSSTGDPSAVIEGNAGPGWFGN